MEGLEFGDGLVPIDAAEGGEQRGQAEAGIEGVADGGGGGDLQAGAFAEEENAEDMIEIGIGEEDAVDGALPAGAGGGLEGRGALDLDPEIGRGINQKPRAAVGAQGDAGLGAGRPLPCPGAAAIEAFAVPLRKAATGGGA